MSGRVTVAARVIEGIPVDRARLRLTMTYQVNDDLRVGVEVNPKGDVDIGPLVNWRLVEESARRPALIVGTSSDRIGTTHGRAYYATLSKSLENETGLPIAPYAGVSYGSFDDELDPIGGLSVRYSSRVSSSHLYDGENLHHLLGYDLDGGQRVGLIVAEQDEEYYVGLTFAFGFGLAFGESSDDATP